MAFDDFDSSEPEKPLDDEDLFDFPKMEFDDDLSVAEEEDPGYPEEVVEAAAALQEEIDAGEDDDIFGLTDEELGDLDLDDLLGDDDFLQEVSELEAGPEPTPAPLAAPATEPEAELAPEPAPIEEPAAADPEPEPVEEEPEEFLDMEALEEDVVLEPAVAEPEEPARERVNPMARLSTLMPANSTLPIVSALLLFNVIVLVLGLSAISSISSSVDEFGDKLGNVVRDMQNEKVLQARESTPVSVTDVIAGAASEETQNAEEPELEEPSYSRGELRAARTEIDSGSFQAARRRLFGLLATIDDPLSEDDSSVEEEANLLIAETYVAEADAMKTGEE